MLDKEKILDFMTKRKEILYDQVTRDFSGGPSDKLAQHNELKYWKEAIERGEFDAEESPLSKYYKPFETPEEAEKKMKEMSELQQMFVKEYLGDWVTVPKVVEVPKVRDESKTFLEANDISDMDLFFRTSIAEVQRREFWKHMGRKPEENTCQHIHRSHLDSDYCYDCNSWV